MYWSQKRRENLLFLFKSLQHQPRRQGGGVPHRHDLCGWPTRLLTIPDSVLKEPAEDRVPNQTGRTPLFPQPRRLDGFSPNLIREEQSGKAVVKPTTSTDQWIVFVADVVRRVISYIARPKHDLCAQWSMIVASETCLCLKSYLGSSRVRSGQVSWHVRRIGSDRSGDLTRQPFVNGTRRVSPDTGTEDGGTRSIARGRHLR